MNQNQFWNEKFSIDSYLYGKQPNEFISVSSLQLLKQSDTVLCLGEGEGRNAVFFAMNGYSVDALDASDVGLKKLDRYALEKSVNINTICIDLLDWKPTKKYQLIASSFLHMHMNDREKLFHDIKLSLAEDGYFIGEFFSTNQLKFNSGGPKDVDLLYTVDDFKQGFEGFIIHELEEIEVELNEGEGHQGTASVIRIIAQKNS